MVESAIAGRSKEVALAALACLTGLLGAQGTACPGLVWRRSLRALGVGIEAATSPLCLVPLQVLLAPSQRCAALPLHVLAPVPGARAGPCSLTALCSAALACPGPCAWCPCRACLLPHTTALSCPGRTCWLPHSAVDSGLQPPQGLCKGRAT